MGITLSPEKSIFCVQSCNFAGLTVGPDEVSVPDKYYAAMDEFKKSEPRNTAELQRFLGFANYLSKFVPNFSDLTFYLTESVNSEEKNHGCFVWGLKQKEAYKATIEALTKELKLSILRYGPDEEIHISTDASCHGLAIIISQYDREKKALRMTHCWSRKTSLAEQHYSAFHLEAIAVASIIPVFGHLLQDYVTKKIISVDAKSIWLIARGSKKMSIFFSFLNEVRTTLQPCTFLWVAGSKNIAADAASRIANDKVKMDKVQWLEFMGLSPIELAEKFKKAGLDAALHNESFWAEIFSWPEAGLEKVPSSMPTAGKASVVRRSKRLTRHRDWMDLTHDERLKLTELSSSANLFTQKRVKEEALKYWPANEEDEGARQCHSKDWHLPAAQIQQVFGVSKGVAEEIVTKCPKCIANPAPNQHPHIERAIREPLGPMKKLYVDVWQMTLPNGRAYTHEKCLIGVCGFTKYIMVEPIADEKSEAITAAMDKMWRYLGTPEVIFSDNARCFRSRHFYDYAAKRGIMLDANTPKNSDGNLAERNIRSVKEVLQRLVSYITTDNIQFWSGPDNLFKAITYLNTLKKSAECKSPFELMFSYSPDLKVLFGSKRPNTESERPTSHPLIFHKIKSAVKNNLRKSLQQIDNEDKVANQIKPGDIVRFNRNSNQKKSNNSLGIVSEIDGTNAVIYNPETQNLISRSLKQITFRPRQKSVQPTADYTQSLKN